MIKYIKGDLFNGSELAFVHGCNCFGSMGAGIAKTVATKYPNVYKEYRQLCDSTENKRELLGTIHMVAVTDRIAINAFTQYNMGNENYRYVSYDAIDDCFRQINDILPKMDIKEVAFPLIGAGLANGKWDVIEQIIVANLTKVKPICYVI